MRMLIAAYKYIKRICYEIYMSVFYYISVLLYDTSRNDDATLQLLQLPL